MACCLKFENFIKSVCENIYQKNIKIDSKIETSENSIILGVLIAKNLLNISEKSVKIFLNGHYNKINLNKFGSDGDLSEFVAFLRDEIHSRDTRSEVSCVVKKLIENEKKKIKIGTSFSKCHIISIFIV